MYYNKLGFSKRLEVVQLHLENEQASRRIAEQSLQDLEKEKICVETEIKQIMARYRHEIASKEVTIGMVS